MAVVPLVQKIGVHVVIDHHHVKTAVAIQVVHRDKVRGSLVDDVVAIEDAFVGRVVVRDRHVLRGIQRGLLDHVHDPITIHIGDGTRGTKGRKAHLTSQAAVGLVGKKSRPIVDQQPVVVVKDLGPTGVVITEVQVQIAITVDVTRSNRAKSRTGRGVHFRNSGILEPEALPHPARFTQVDVDPRVGKMLLTVVRQGRCGGHVQPAISVEVGQDHIPVVGRGQEALVSRDI